jgi:hypothetical protein
MEYRRIRVLADIEMLRFGGLADGILDIALFKLGWWKYTWRAE